METGKLKKFAQFARRSLLEQVTAKLKIALADESPARRESLQAIKKLEKAVTDQGKEQVIEQVAYIWFNRFCALRFMDVNRYSRIGIVSPAGGQFQPEILADAKMGHIDDEMVSEPTRQKIFALLNGKTPSQDPQGEAYRLLVVAACNYWHSAMPFLFERIDDYTELLMPDDLLSGNSVLAYTREAMTPDACEDVEVIGWLYQFYISERKDQVFAGLKKNKKVTPENIPAATQLFTPHWIVRYLVENSLGRLWMLNRPDSSLIDKMDYYIKPEEPEADFLRINTPEEIKICDPACGSGHMLTYAFDLLYVIYEEEGYESTDIPSKILTHNLHGIEIDERAGELAAFALTMKARAKQRRFFRKPVQPNVLVLENVAFTKIEMQDVEGLVGNDFFTAELYETLNQFEQAKNFGSLIVPKISNASELLHLLKAQNSSSDLLLTELHSRLTSVLRMADALSPKYHVLVANPPYMHANGMNPKLKVYLQSFFPNSKSDLMTAFMERAILALLPNGAYGMINLPSWMFLGSFEKLRLALVKGSSITSLLHLGRGIFGSDFGSVAFIIRNSIPNDETHGFYRRLFEKHVQVRAPTEIERLFFDSSYGRFQFKQADLLAIPGNPISYWLSSQMLEAFKKNDRLGEQCDICVGLQTGDNERFLRYWHEIDQSLLKRENNSGWKWVPYTKGGEFRKWYGNKDYVLDWSNDGAKIRQHPSAVLRNHKRYFENGITYTNLSSGSFSARIKDDFGIFDQKGSVFLPHDSGKTEAVLALLLSKPCAKILEIICPTLDFNPGSLVNLPVCHDVQRSDVQSNAAAAITLGKSDWDASETSWDFATLPLLSRNHHGVTLEESYADLRTHWQGMTDEMQCLEVENNRIFIEAYGLQDELTPELPIEEVTLTCNPAYRYGIKGSERDRETRLLADTMAELISYAVGCMFGRYALDKPGLILAKQGETIEDYLKQIPEPSFPADDDNVIPILDGDWFTDDITERFREFLRIAFGEEHYGENLRFVEQALGKDIRKYFLKDFYNDHMRRYKKRPIYWLFSSPKGSFNALVYMHRYQPHTVGTVLEYLRDFKDEKLKARKNHLEAVSISAGASQGEKTKALKEIEKIKKIFVELDDYERDVLYPLATKQVEIELDNGVKANYPRFGDALKKIPGLS
ncbi:BREX-1 system adenine-specific DNA-methyltransferase PglX [Cobetia marina]|uniref:BREX-1 system adenine-specific DNA-methyltransferase PglX n=1 Tax=Cobetia marina TaxID=28258 RepID=UPI003A9351F0